MAKEFLRLVSFHLVIWVGCIDLRNLDIHGMASKPMANKLVSWVNNSSETWANETLGLA